MGRPMQAPWGMRPGSGAPAIARHAAKIPAAGGAIAGIPRHSPLHPVRLRGGKSPAKLPSEQTPAPQATRRTGSQ